MAPESIIESTGMQDILGMDEYEESITSNTVRSNSESSYDGDEEVSQQGRDTSYSLGSRGTEAFGAKKSTSNPPKETSSRSPRVGKKTNKTRNNKIGGNKGQLLIDPWLSADIPTQHDDRQSIGGTSRLRRTSAGRSRFDHEPLALMSISATTPGILRDETPGPTFISPRKHAGDIIEINCSDQDEREIDESQVKRNTGMAKTKSTSHGNALLVSSSSGRRRLIRSNSSLMSINVISSSDEEGDQPITPLRNRKSARGILDNSDSENDENSVRSSHPRNMRPVADDTIPQLPNTPPTYSATVAPGSDTKMPWSIANGPDRDIVLSTPTSKQKIRHYNVILDSEDELSDAEGIFDIWKGGKNAAHSRHLNLFGVDFAGNDETKKCPSHAIISDSEVEATASDAPLTQKNDIFIISQSTMEECGGKGEEIFSEESQDFFELPNKSRLSPDKGQMDIKGITKLRKPRPLVLDPLSEGEADSNGGGKIDPKEAIGVEEQHLKLRMDLFGDVAIVNPQLGTVNQMLENKQRLVGDQSGRNSLLVRPSFGSVQMKLKLVDSDDIMKYYPLWKRKNEIDDVGVQVKGPSTAIEDEEEEEEEEEPLEDPRARRRSQYTYLNSPQKRIRLTEIAPDVAAMELALRAADTPTRQLPNSDLPHLSRMETIESFSTISDSQMTAHQIGRNNSRIFSQNEEIEGFSDDHRSQILQKQQCERRVRRYSGLQFADRDRSTVPFRDPEGNSHSQPQEDTGTQPEIGNEPSELHEEREVSPILLQGGVERCPICRKSVPSNELLAHVDAELLANEQKQKDDMERQDKAMALALDKIYQTQDLTTEDSLSRRGLLTQDSPSRRHKVFNPTESSASDEGWNSNAISIDTPTRKVGSLRLEISPGLSEHEDDSFVHVPSHLSLHKMHSSSTILSGGLTDNEQEVEYDSIVLSDVESISSQSAFRIQPGQTIHDSSLAASEALLVKPPTNLTSVRKSHKGRGYKKLETGSLDSPLVVLDDMQDEGLDDDLDDFLDRPEPASMMNRSFRGSTSANRAKVGARISSKNSKGSKKIPKETVELDDSEDEISSTSRENGASLSYLGRSPSAKKGKPRTNVLDSLLPAPARQRRQSLLKQHRDRLKGPTVDIEDEIEIGRLQPPLTEKFWNREDDPFDAESLDRRQVKGIGLGGIIGGVGAIPGSLSTSRVTTNSVAASETLISTQEDHSTFQQDTRLNKNLDMTQPSFGFEDNEYRLHSQEWWDNSRSDNQKYSHGNTDPQDDLAERYSQVVLGDPDSQLFPDDMQTSTLDDFIDLRKRRDDPALAMYFAQFSSDTGASSKEPGRGRGRGRGRGQARSVGETSVAPLKKRGVSFGPGVGPMPTTMEPRSTQTVLTAYGSLGPGSTPRVTKAIHDDDGDRYGARKISFGYATTDNGSMAIRSKPTQPSVPPRGSGAKGGKSRPFRRSRWPTQRGKGRGGRAGGT
ncbi:hypothetical protein BGZ76_000161 [Entomortierella beljakovae]|nr:hypothetical protein BGZ76_000161 [Entomortierella beljakovae]